ncbi:response regulator transcription factor [Labilibacter marinus]|uniref:response regulator transcription factor n=1 Tax=Labilibacter marinus TaxID=1477105 RepID=UPI000836235F|nr:response regulator transcription factor [Labilibacter marinus]
MYKVLIVEDDPDIFNLINIHLKDLECDTQIAENGKLGFELAQKTAFDLIILDIMLPEMNGIMVCQKLRALDNFTPILMLTAKSEEIDKVLGLESGADDYITKPFGIREFIARVKAILRRQDQNSQGKQENAHSQFFFDGLNIDKEKRKVTYQEKRIDLTPKEFELLALMAEHPGTSYDRDQLLRLVWGYEFNGYEHTVNSHINRLRAKIEPDINKPKYILTTWGVGYRFNDDI